MHDHTEPTTAAPVEVVSEGGWGVFGYLIYSFFGAGVALLAGMVYLVLDTRRLLEMDIALGLIGVATIVVGLGSTDRMPRKLTLDSETIEIHYSLSRVRLKWSQLRPPVLSTRGFLDFRASSGTRGVWGGLTVTTQQARAILDHPACPHFELSLDVVSELARVD